MSIATTKPVFPLATLGILLGTLSVGCSEPAAGSPDSAGCDGGKCDDADGDVLAVLDGRSDPIAVFLRDVVDEEGFFDMDYVGFLEQLAGSQGCARSTIESYIISDELVVSEGEDAFPRVISTVCSTDRTKADRAFFALSFANADRTDIDTQRVEMFAWDPESTQYNFYQTFGDDESFTGRYLTVEDAECQGCHLTPEGVDSRNMPMTPIMNELSAPWEHWMAEPVSLNHHVPDGLDEAVEYSNIAGPDSGFRRSAGRLEQTIASAYNQRIASNRLRARRSEHGAGDAAKETTVEEAMSLLRPLFCDEQVTYATEDGASGLLLGGAVIDDGWHSVFFQVRGTGWSWEWWNARKLRLDPPGAPDAVSMMPIRGSSVVQYEKSVLSLRALKPEQVARIRALDWHRPVLSQFRCDLYHHALERVRTPAGIDDIEYDESTRTLNVMRELFDEIFVVHPGDFGVSVDEPVTIAAGAADRFVALSEANPAAIQDLIASLLGEGLPECTERGDGACEATLNQMGDILETRFKAMEAGGRADINALKQERGCEVEARFPNKPFIAGLQCSSTGAPGGDSSPDTGADTAGDTDSEGTDGSSSGGE